jgi:hypothetical protein
VTTKKALIERAYELLRLKGAAVGESTIVRLNAVFQEALTRASERVAASTDKRVRNLLRQEYLLDVVGGVGDMTAALAADPPPLMDFFGRAELRVPNVEPAVASTPVKARSQLARDWPAGYVYHALEGNSVYFRNVDGALDTLTETVPVFMNYLLTDAGQIAHRQVETMVVAELASLASGIPVEKLEE